MIEIFSTLKMDIFIVRQNSKDILVTVFLETVGHGFFITYNLENLNHFTMLHQKSYES